MEKSDYDITNFVVVAAAYTGLFAKRLESLHSRMLAESIACIALAFLFSLKKIKFLLQLARIAFKGMKQLNTIQSRVFETAYSTNENLLICAPTGAGKTNVAMLTIVREIGRNVESGVIQLDKFKVRLRV